MIIGNYKTGGGGGKLTSDAIFEALDGIPEMHRNIFRGKNLGSTFTDEQKAAIKDGTFHDLWVGDYWTSNGTNYYIADFNYWIHTIGVAKKNHVLIWADVGFGRSIQIDFKNSSGKYTGYGAAKLRDTLHTTVKTIITSLFSSDNILEYKDYLSTNGSSSRNESVDCSIELPTVCMVFGNNKGAKMAATLDMSGSKSTRQLALFRLNFDYWLVSNCSFQDTAAEYDVLVMDPNSDSVMGSSASHIDSLSQIVFGITG